MPTFYTRSDGKRIPVPDDVTPEEMQQIADAEEALIKTQVPSAPTIPSASPSPSTWDKVKSVADWAFNKPQVPEAPEAYYDKAKEVLGPTLGKYATAPMRALSPLASSFTTPVALVTLPFMGAGRAATALPWLAKALPAARAVDQVASLGYGIQGANTAIEGAFDPNASTGERLGQVGAGALQAGMAAFGMAHPAVPKSVPKVAPKTPLPPSISKLIGPERQLPAMAGSGSTPDFYSGPAGVTRVDTPVPGQPALEPDLLPQPSAGRVRTPTTIDTTNPHIFSGTSGPEYTAGPQVMVQAEKSAINRAMGDGPLGQATLPSTAENLKDGTFRSDPHTIQAEKALFEAQDRLRRQALSQGKSVPANLGKTLPTGSGEMPWSSEAGRISPALLNILTGGTAGAVGGSFVGDTPEERLKNSARFGLAGAAGFGLLSRKPKFAGSVNPRLKALQKAQASGKSPAYIDPAFPRSAAQKLWDNYQQSATNIVAPLANRVKRSLQQMAKRTGEPIFKPDGRPNLLPTSKDGYKMLVLNIAGGVNTEGHGAALRKNYHEFLHTIESQGLAAPLDDVLNLKAFGHVADATIPEHIATNYAKALHAEASGDLASASKFRKEAQALEMGLAKGELLPQGYNPDLIKQDLAALEIEQGPELWKRTTEAAQEVYQLNAASMALGESMLDPELVQVLKARIAVNGDYNPMNRILDAHNSLYKASKGADLPKFTEVQYFAGSDKDTINPRLAALVRYENTVAQYERNLASKTLYEMKDLGPEFGWIKPVPEYTAIPKGYKPLHYVDQGKHITYAVPDYIADSVTFAAASDMNFARTWLGKVLQRSSKLQRWTAIAGNPAFSVANAPRDIGDTLYIGKGLNRLNPGDHAELVLEFAKGWKHAIAEDAEYLKFLGSGAANSGLTQQLTPDYLFTGRAHSFPGRGVQKLARFSNASEMGPKQAGIKMLAKRGWDKLDAAWEVRQNWGSPDFWKRGLIMKEIGPWSFLLNGAIQGVARNSRLFTDPRLLTEGLFLTGVTSMAVAKWNAQFKDSDGQPSIKRASRDDMLENFVMVNPSTNMGRVNNATGKREWDFVKIPMGFAQRGFFAPALFTLYNAMGLRDEDPEQIALSTIGGQIPGQFKLEKGNLLESTARGFVSSLGPVPRTVTQQLMNKNTSFNIPIIPGSMQTARATDQWDAGTDPLARLLSKGTSAVLGPESPLASPKRLEHILGGIGLRTGAAEPLEKTLGLAAASVTGMPTKPLPKWSEDKTGFLRERLQPFAPILRRVIGTGVDQVQRDRIDEFYDLYGKAQKFIDNLRFLESSPARRPEEAMKLRNDPQNQVLKAFYPTLQKRAGELSQLHKLRLYQLEHPGPQQKPTLDMLNQTEAQLLKATETLMAQIKKAQDQHRPEPVR
jgi:hypothetical protein